ncbi:hypothetical protein BX600DRAFT_508538 [Xylariales sp. PMI_506]|nr:hypothetical protein BX600DRAFT_508538 [Xylariales sp. PMI_506]
MALQAVYKQFLAAPDAGLLASDASLHYVTTTTTYRGALDIVKHIATLRNQVKKKKEDFLTVIEGSGAVAIEVETVLEFATSGGAYLPGLDDNFLTERTVFLPIMHIVAFNSSGKIQQIRQSWDQGSLLKQLDVIGRTGRNWPIRDSQEQIKLIRSCVNATSSAASASAQNVGLPSHARGNSTNVLRDPHASLALFAPREEAEQETLPSIISPRGGAQPRQRDFAEILGDEPVHDVGSPSAGRQRSDSPSKSIAPKIGAGKNFQPNRLFDAEKVLEAPDSPENAASSNRYYRPNPKKFNHFDFVDGSDPSDAPQPGNPTFKQTKHSSQWSFDDFVTPQKHRPTKVLQQNNQAIRHWGAENEDDIQEESEQQAAVGKPRRDAEPHFEFVDDGLPEGEPRVGRPRGAGQNTGLGLYTNNIYSEGGAAVDVDNSEDHALGNITNLKNRGKTFTPQFAMTDESPAPKIEKPLVSQDRMKAVKMMDSSWDTYGESPAQKENNPIKSKPSTKGKSDDRGIHIGGDGMGGSRGTNRDWLFGDGEDEPKPAPGRKQGAASKTGGFNWDF